MHVLFKIAAKLYEFLLRIFCPVPIQYFCEIFPSRPYPAPEAQRQPCQLDIFIPFRDKWNLTKQCLTSVIQQNMTSIDVTIHLIDNGSSAETQESVGNWIQLNQGSVKFIQHRIDEPFNFSKLCNVALGIPSIASRFFLFLNNDVILSNKDSLSTSTQFIQINRDCGALGITLLYENRTIQHLFAAPGVKIIAAHPFKNRPANILKDWNANARKVPSVTGAYLMVPADYFCEVGGFDENLPTTGQDIDLCLKLQKRGWGTWVLPKIQAVHLESASRRKSRINRAEVEYVYGKWQDTLLKHPDYPLRISRWSEQPVRRILEGRYPYELFI